MRRFDSLGEREALALAITVEAEGERIHADYDRGLRPAFPASAAVCEAMHGEESEHCRRPLQRCRKKFDWQTPEQTMSRRDSRDCAKAGERI